MAKTDERASQVAKRSRAFTRACTSLGMRVRALRHARDLTLEAAAERMNLDLKHLQKVEAGQLNVTMVTLVRIASGFGVPLAQLFADEASVEPIKKVPKGTDGTRPKRTASTARARTAGAAKP